MPLVVLFVLLLTTAVRSAEAQQPASRDRPPATERLPRAVSREVARLYDEPHALRAFDRIEIPPARIVEGNVSVIDGPLIVAGHVRGRVLAINSDVLFRPGARVDGDILVIGGEIEGERDAVIGGELRRYGPSLHFTRDGERIVISEEDRAEEADTWWRRWERRRTAHTRGKFVIASAGAYNRVEGLPVDIGPVVELRPQWGVVHGKAFAVARTATSFHGGNTALGYDVQLEYRTGPESGLRINGKLFDVNAPVESWQLTRLEYGLAAFLFRRDYQDFYGRRGGGGYLGLFDAAFGEIGVAYTHERWDAREAANPFTLFRGGAWRPNPVMDAGQMHVVRARANVDTRNDNARPWSGWYIEGEVERGAGTLDAIAPTPADTRSTTPGPVAYTRGFLDARRYNRVGPSAQLNFRLVTGGWLGGDDLPLQRRLSVSGAGALPGFDFRTPVGATDVGTCNGPAGAPSEVVVGQPALCDRIALAQVEYRGDLHFDLFGGIGWRNGSLYLRNDATWVVFADAGRGWLVGPRSGTLRYGADQLPPLGTFRTDIGAGLDFGQFGVFVTKALSDGSESANVLFRLRHRF